MHTRHVIAVFAVFGIFLVAGGALARSKGSIEYGNKVAKWGEMSLQDFYRIDDVRTKVEHNGAVTDQDLDFGIHLLETQAPNPRQTVDRRFDAVLDVTGASMYKRWTAKQKDKLFAAALWLLDQPQPKKQIAAFNPVAMDKLTAIDLLSCVHDRRVLPYLRKFEKDTDPAIAEAATTYYQQIAGGKK